MLQNCAKSNQPPYPCSWVMAGMTGTAQAVKIEPPMFMPTSHSHYKACSSCSEQNATCFEISYVSQKEFTKPIAQMHSSCINMRTA